MSVRVLHVITGLGPGGAETVLYRLAMRQSDIKHEIICLAGRDEWYTPTLEQHGITVHHLDMSSVPSGVSGAVQLRRLIERSKADVLQCWMYRPNVLAGMFGRLAGIPVIWNIRCSSPELLGFTSRLWAHAGGFLARWVPSFIIICSNRSTEFHSGGGYSRVDQRVIHNGYDPQAFFPDDEERSETRRSLGIAADEFLIGSVARWNAYKNIPMLLRAARIAHDRGVRLKCLLVGHQLDTGNPELMKAIDEAGCGGLVVPLGRRTDVQRIARALDLHVLASRSEGFPNVVAETMLSGTPNAATDVGDAGLVIGDTGWVVPSEEAEAMATAIRSADREWRDQPEKWQGRRTAARKRIVEEFSLGKMADAYEEVWRSCAAERRVSAQRRRLVHDHPLA